MRVTRAHQPGIHHDPRKRRLEITTSIVRGKNEPWTEELVLDTHQMLCKGVNHPKYGTPWKKYGGKYRKIMPQPGMDDR